SPPFTSDQDLYTDSR
nr:RecName: Full=Peroxidase 2 [Daucus carota]